MLAVCGARCTASSSQRLIEVCGCSQGTHAADGEPNDSDDVLLWLTPLGELAGESLETVGRTHTICYSSPASERAVLRITWTATSTLR